MRPRPVCSVVRPAAARELRPLRFTVLVAGSSLAALAARAAPAAAAAKHAGSGKGTLDGILVACIVVLLLAATAGNVVRRRRRGRLVRQAASAPLSPAAVLGRVPPGQDVYGHDLYANDLAQPAGQPASGGPRARSGLHVLPRRPVQPGSGKPADANMLSYELERLSVLRDSGRISEKEYAEARARLLG